MKIQSYICALLGGLLLGSCANKSQSSQNLSTISFERVNEAAVYSLNGSGTEFGDSADWQIGMRIDVMMPAIIYGDSATVLRDSIFARALGLHDSNCPELSDFFNETASQFDFPASALTINDSIQAFLKNSDSALVDYDASASVVGCVTYLSPKIMSYSITSSIYPPRAAHGMYVTYGINYDMTAHNIISLHDLITREGLQQLPGIVAQKASRMTRIIGRTSISALPFDQNFIISPRNEIVLIYQPMEVASFAQGTIEIPLEPYDMSQYLTEYARKLLLND